MGAHVASFVASCWNAPPDAFALDFEPLHGGLESTVIRARVTSSLQPSVIPSAFVIKQLPSGRDREALVYSLLWQRLRRPPAPRVFGGDLVQDRTYLYLEDVRADVPWPWANTCVTSLVCRELARLHQSTALPREPFAWDYETELTRSAESTLELADAARDASGRRYWTRMGDLRCVVAALPDIRRYLLAGTLTIIHGDLHPGNVLVRTRGDTREAVFIDWGRARLGSPLEDVSSWLQSLGCWEPQARRRHDTLMRAYLEARTDVASLTPMLRIEYWLASASNGLAGAIRYHLAVLSDRRSSADAFHHSQLALGAWHRVMRRAAAVVRTTRLRPS
jgi:hypothetical protein